MKGGLKEISRWETFDEQGRLIKAPEFPRIVPATHTVIDYEGSLYQELDGIPAVGRLYDVEQLGLASSLSLSFAARQSRYGHSLNVATELDYLAQGFGLDRTLAVTAGMIHDIATTPYSDSISKPLGLDDQEYFRPVLESSREAMQYLDRHGIDPDRLESLVRGEDDSPLGQLVSSKDSIDVDRWAYVVEDGVSVNAEELVSSSPDRGPGQRYDVNPFRDVDLQDERVVFTDVPEVHDFLELRAEMFETFYKNPKLLAKEAFLGRTVQEMWEDGVLDEDNIFTMIDGQLKRLVYDYNEDVYWDIFRIDGFDLHGSVECEVEEINAFLSREIDESFETRERFSVSAAVSTPVVVDGDILPYSEAQPAHAQELEERLDGGSGVHVYGRERSEELAEAVEIAVETFGGETPSS